MVLFSGVAADAQTMARASILCRVGGKRIPWSVADSDVRQRRSHAVRADRGMARRVGGERPRMSSGDQESESKAIHAVPRQLRGAAGQAVAQASRPRGWSRLHEAAHQGDVERVRLTASWRNVRSSNGCDLFRDTGPPGWSTASGARSERTGMERRGTLLALALLATSCGSDTTAVAGIGPKAQEVPPEPRRVASVTVAPEHVTMALGDTLRLAATAFDQHGAAMEAEITWSGDLVASVDGAGLVRAIGEGLTEVAAAYAPARIRATARVAVARPVVDADADPYPIRLHWVHCRDNFTYSGCASVDDPRTLYGDIIVDVAEATAATWSRVLHPTLRTPWVAPVQGWDQNWERPPSLWGFEPGDTLPPGLDVIIGAVDDPESHATGSPAQPPDGPGRTERLSRHHDRVRLARVVVEPRNDSRQDQEFVMLHEFGHAIAATNIGLDAWTNHLVGLPLDSVRRRAVSSLARDTLWVQTHPLIVEAYERFGGGGWDWFARDLGVPMDGKGGHWHPCAAPQDVMTGWYYHPPDGSPRVPTRITPLTAVAATIHGGFEVDLSEVAPVDYHVPHYWYYDRRCLVLEK